MIEVKELPIDPAVAYLRGVLGDWSKLCSFLEHLPLEDGKACALAPQMTEADRLLRFCEGGLDWGGESAIDVLCEMALQTLTKMGNGVALFLAMGKPSAPYLGRIKVPLAFCENEVYLFLRTNEVARPRMFELLHRAARYPQLGVITRVPTGANSLADRKRLAVLELEALVSEAACVITGAYDEESYLIWTPRLPGDSVRPLTEARARRGRTG